MRKIYQSERTGKSYHYGIDRTTGLFIQVLDAEGHPEINFSEFYPFQQVLTPANLKEAVKNKLIDKQDLIDLKKQALGVFDVYFEDIYVIGPELTQEERVQLPKGLLKIAQQEKPARVKTIGDYLRNLNYFKDKTRYTFLQVAWVDVKKNEILYTVCSDTGF